MKIDSAIREFSEKYDRTAIQSINDISNDYALNIQKRTIGAFNIKEGFENFKEFISGYAEYKINNMDNESATPQSLICEHTKKFINVELFNDTPILYSDIPTFIETYITGIQLLLDLTESVKVTMLESGVDQDSIGDVNEFMDCFMNKLHESFDPTMNRILWASGYNSKIKLTKPNKDSVQEIKPVFL